MKCAMVFWGELFPINMGNKRYVVDILDGLAERGIECDLFCIARWEGPHPKDSTIHYIESPTCSLLLRIANKAVSTVTPNVLWRDLVYTTVAKHRIGDALEGYDLVFCNYVANLKSLPSSVLEKVFLIAHDVVHFRLASFMVNPFIVELTKRSEIAWMRKVKAIILTAEYERDLLKDVVPEDKLYVLGIPQKMVQPTNFGPFEYDLGFIGGLSDQNERALRYFAKRCGSACKDMTLLIAGSICESRVCNELSSVFKVTRGGYLEDIERFYTAVRFVIGTIDVGSGVKVKNIEAMAHGKPLIANSKGLEGIPNVPEEIVINMEAITQTELRKNLLGLFSEEAYHCFSDRVFLYASNSFEFNSCYLKFAQYVKLSLIHI